MSNMELRYTENQTNNVNFSMKVKSHLYSKQSDFQKIDIIDTYEFGTEKGILINQCESPYYPLNSKEMKRSFNKLNSLFPICEAYQYHMPTYPSGHWMFCFASKTLHPIKDLDAAYWNSLGLETKYYNTDLHVGCFALPNYVKAQLIEE